MKIFDLRQKDFFPISFDAADSFGIILNEDFIPSDWFCLELAILGGDDCSIRLEWAESPESEPQFYMVHTIIPNCKATLSFPITERNFALHSTFIPPFGALRKGMTNGKPLKKEKASFVRISFSGRIQKIDIDNIYCSAERPTGSLSGKPILDPLGQRKEGYWPNKTRDEEALTKYLKEELRNSKTASFPEGWSDFGGWKRLRLAATGFFRTEKIGDKWWLIDPDGYLFFSNGVSYPERAGVFGLTEEYRALHEFLPPKDGEFTEAYSTAANIPQYIVRNGIEGADKKEMFSFGRANLIRAFGKDWYKAYTKITTARMRRMGFNTVCVGTNDYFDEQTDYFLKKSKLPYVVTFRDFPLTDERIFRDFPDVFSKEYENRCRNFAERSLLKYKGDPYLIGYFVTNEPEWLFSGKVNLAEQLLRAKGCAESKNKFIDFLSEKYSDVKSFNTAWNTNIYALSDLLTLSFDGIDFTDAAREDMRIFECELIRKYSSTVCNALRDVDPDHLNLGMRYYHFSERITSIDKGLFDVFSINCYDTSPNHSAERFASRHDLPIMVGEWHFGARECGLPAFGLHFTNTQSERAAACLYYSETATQNKNIVGIHYFEYNDQPYFGRFDGECYQIGLFDLCHKPYAEVCIAFKSFAERLYPMLLGELPVTAEPQTLIK